MGPAFLLQVFGVCQLAFLTLLTDESALCRDTPSPSPRLPPTLTKLITYHTSRGVALAPPPSPLCLASVVKYRAGAVPA